MFPIRIKACSESDLRMLGDLARNIQRVLPVTQADIDAAAALGKGWVVWKVVEVNDPIDNLRGGTQLVIKQNSIQPGQNVRRVLIVSGPGGETVVIGPGTSPLSLPSAVANSLSYVKAFGGTEQNGTPTPDAPVDIVSNNGVLKARHASGLPLGYTLLEYIEFDGNTYIDTGITPLNSGATINMKITPSTIANLQFLYGQNPTEGMQQVGCFLYTNGKISWQYSALRLVTNVVAVGTTYDITLGNGSVTINGTTTTGTPDTPFTTNMTVLVGAAWSPNYTSVDARRFVGKVYAFSYKLGGQTLVNLVPAKNSSNVVGMYDLVSGQFFTNAGTGTFTAGDPVSDPVEIYTDGTVETINVHGKNLCNLETPYVMTSSSSNYNNSLTPTWYKFKENTRYTITYRFTPEEVTHSAAGNLIFTVITYTDGTTDYNCGIKDDNLSSGIATYTTTAGKTIASIVGLYKHNRFTGGTITINSMQIEEGTTSTDYEPYYDGGTATTEMLLKLGDYQDVQSIIDGSITRNVGVKVLDGTENWTNPFNNGRFILLFPSAARYGAGASVNLYCSHFEAKVSAAISLVLGCGFYANTLNDPPQLRMTYPDMPMLSDFKQYLADQYAAGTPVIIVYPLATPTTESVAGQTLQVTAGDNVLEITQASLTGLELEAKYEKESA